MEEIFLDACQMTSKSDAHNYIKKMLNFPDYYGKNLDALWDLLSSRSKMTSILLLHEEKLYENLGEYGKKLAEVFKEAAKTNPCIEFMVI